MEAWGCTWMSSTDHRRLLASIALRALETAVKEGRCEASGCLGTECVQSYVGGEMSVVDVVLITKIFPDYDNV